MNIVLATLNLSSEHILQAIRPIDKPVMQWSPCHTGMYADKSYYTSSIQRYITPQCHTTPLPYHDAVSGCSINADVYLTNHDALCDLLDFPLNTADGKLILEAYQRFGEKCTQYLSGYFAFVLWDSRHQTIFAATDRRGKIPLFYAYRSQEYFICSNVFSYFRSYIDKLAVNEAQSVFFAFDSPSPTETAYRNVMKLAAGHQLIVNKKGLRIQRYFDIKKNKQVLPYTKREEYFEAFRDCFSKAIQKSLRVIGPITTQCSGGLDSSAVTAMTAKLLAEKNQILLALTAIPAGLHGESYRKGWYYHEMPRIQAILNKYPNIRHAQYLADPATNIFLTLEKFYPYIDQPLRNITNMDWIIGNYENTVSQQSRVLLTGAHGNGTISWAGQSYRNILSDLYQTLRVKLSPEKIFSGFFDNLHPALLSSKKGKKLLLNRGGFLNRHERMLVGSLGNGLSSSVYILQLYYGVRTLDPTSDDHDLLAFCYNLPQWVYYRGKSVLERRLLVREGLQDILPPEITQNPYRGEQGADWYLQYNTHQHTWKNRLLDLHPDVKKILWETYDEAKMMDLFEKYPVIESAPDQAVTRDVCLRLMRCLSAAFYFNYCVGEA